VSVKNNLVFELQAKIAILTEQKFGWKLLPIVNFTNILRAAFVLIFFCKIITITKSKHIKAAQNTFVQKKLLVKFW